MIYAKGTMETGVACLNEPAPLFVLPEWMRRARSMRRWNIDRAAASPKSAGAFTPPSEMRNQNVFSALQRWHKYEIKPERRNDQTKSHNCWRGVYKHSKKYPTLNYTGHQFAISFFFSQHKFHQAVYKHCACIKINLTLNVMIASAGKSPLPIHYWCLKIMLATLGLYNLWHLLGMQHYYCS